MNKHTKGTDLPTEDSDGTQGHLEASSVPSDTIEQTRKLDTIQRHIWARINDEINLRGIKISIGDAYSLGSVIKEVLHPEVEALIRSEKLRLLERLLKHKELIWFTDRDDPAEAVVVAAIEAEQRRIEG